MASRQCLRGKWRGCGGWGDVRAQRRKIWVVCELLVALRRLGQELQCPDSRVLMCVERSEVRLKPLLQTRHTWLRRLRCLRRCCLYLLLSKCAKALPQSRHVNPDWGRLFAALISIPIPMLILLRSTLALLPEPAEADLPWWSLRERVEDVFTFVVVLVAAAAAAAAAAPAAAAAACAACALLVEARRLALTRSAAATEKAGGAEEKMPSRRGEYDDDLDARCFCCCCCSGGEALVADAAVVVAFAGAELLQAAAAEAEEADAEVEAKGGEAEGEAEAETEAEAEAEVAARPGLEEERKEPARENSRGFHASSVAIAAAKALGLAALATLAACEA